MDDFPRCNKPQIEPKGGQDNKHRPDLAILPQGAEDRYKHGVPVAPMGRVDNECRALPQESAPLGVGIPPIVNREHINPQHVNSGPQHVKSLIHNLNPLSDLVDSGVASNIVEPSQSDITVINELHTHLGRPPG